MPATPPSDDERTETVDGIEPPDATVPEFIEGVDDAYLDFIPVADGGRA